MGEVTLEQAWLAESGRTFSITMGEAEAKGDDIAFTYKATPTDGGEPFVYQAVVTRILMEKLGLSPEDEESRKKLRKISALQGLEDLQRRLSGGHDMNFDGMPYIKMFSLRDKPGFERFL